MPADLHKSLEECETYAKELVQEMRQYKAARELNQKAADALDKVASCLSRVVEEIRPLTARRLRRFMVFQTVAWSLTTLLVLATLLLLLLRKP